MAHVPEGPVCAAREVPEGPALRAMKRPQLQRHHKARGRPGVALPWLLPFAKWLTRALDRAVGPAAPAVCLAAACWPDGLDAVL